MNDDERLPWFRCYPQKLLDALAGMTPAEGYTYVIMLLRIYEAGGACHDTFPSLVRRIGYNKRIVSEALDKLFATKRLIRTPEGIRNPVADKVIGAQTTFRDDRIRSGQKGASARWQKPKQKQSTPHRSAMPLPMANDGDLDLDSDSERNKKVSMPLARPRALLRADREKELFRRGKEVLGKSAGGMITRLLKALAFDLDTVTRIIEEASQKFDAREYFAGAIQAAERRTKKETIADVWDGLQRNLESDPDSPSGEDDHRLLPPR
jgi:hypothetical protein